MLGEGAGYIRYRIRICRLKKIIREELKAIQYQIKQKKDIVSQTIEHLKQQKILPTLSVPIVATGYRQHIGELYEHLSEIERNCLHIIYERLNVADVVLDSFESNFLTAVDKQVLADPYQAYLDRFTEINDSYAVVQELIRSYLKHKPIDVFQILES